MIIGKKSSFFAMAISFTVMLSNSILSGMRWPVFVGTCQNNCPEKTENQDKCASHFLLDIHATVCGVFDGHGSSKVSSLLADKLHRQLNNIYLSRGDENIESALKDAFAVVEAEVVSEAPNAGSTALVAILKEGDKLVLGNVGNSRAMVISRTQENGTSVLTFKLLTTAHALSNNYERARINNILTSPELHEDDPLKRLVKYDRDPEIKRAIDAIMARRGVGSITPEVVMDYFVASDRIGGLNMTRSIGDKKIKEQEGRCGILSAQPDISSVAITKDDRFLVLMSDGFYNVLALTLQEKAKKNPEVQEQTKNFDQASWDAVASEFITQLIVHFYREGKRALLADCVLNHIVQEHKKVFEKGDGQRDDMSIIIVPLQEKAPMLLGEESDLLHEEEDENSSLENIETFLLEPLMREVFSLQDAKACADKLQTRYSLFVYFLGDDKTTKMLSEVKQLILQGAKDKAWERVVDCLKKNIQRSFRPIQDK